MYQVIDKRNTGKTTRLLLLAKEKNATFVAIRKEYAKELLDKYGITGVRIISRVEYFEEIFNKQKYPNNLYVIDELDEMLTHMSIIGYTNTINN